MKTDTKRTKPTTRARKMWGNYYGEFVACHDTRSSAQTGADAGMSALIAIPVAVIPLNDPYALGDAMVSALTAIGVLAKSKGGRK